MQILEVCAFFEGSRLDLKDRVLVKNDFLDVGVARQLGDTGDLVVSQVQLLKTDQLKANFLHARIRDLVLLQAEILEFFETTQA